MIPAFCNGTESTPKVHRVSLLSQLGKESTETTMTKSIDILSDAIRNQKHPFRQVDDRPDKQRKHRYERRKVKEYIKLGSQEDPTIL